MNLTNASSKPEDNQRKQKLITIATITLIFCCFVLLFFFQGKQKVELPAFKNKQKVKKPSGVEQVKVTFNTGINGRLGIVMSIPIEDDEQRRDIWHNYPKLKNDFLVKVDPKEMNGWVEQRNYKAIRTQFLEILNGVLKKPIETVYFDSFFYD